MRINMKLLFMIVAVLILAALTAKSEPRLIDDPGLADSVSVDSVDALLSSGRATVPVRFFNDENLAGVEVTLKWNAPDVVIDSFSFVGSRIEDITIKGATITDSSVIVYAFVFSEDLIASGSGLLGSLYFSYLPTIPSQVVPIDSTTIIENEVEHSVTFSDAGSSAFKPKFKPGALVVAGIGCCVGLTGNVNGDAQDAVNIVDMTYLTAYLFGGGPAPVCMGEANVNGDTGGAVNIIDMTYLTAFLFSGGPAPVACR